MTFHAITSAHSLLSAMIDNHIYWGNECEIDTRRVVWRRVVDMNDRALRQITASLGGVSNGFPREAGFDITVASEVMAILCLANEPRGSGKALGRHDRGLSPRPVSGLLPRHQGGWRDDRAAEGRRCSRTWCRRWKTTRRLSMAARSPTSRMAATRSSRPRPH